MRMKAFGANLPAVSSGGCTGSLTARDRKMEREQEPARQTAGQQRAA